MLYLRGNVYWYQFRMTRKEASGERRKYNIRRSTKTGRRRDAEGVERDHRLALERGWVHPDSPWPAPPPPTLEAPTLKAFSDRFLAYLRTQGKVKPSTIVFYSTSLKRTLDFHPLAEIPMNTVTGELIGKYVRFRQSFPDGNSIAALNAELRSLRRCFRLAEEWAEIPKAPVIHELQGNVVRERIISFDEEQLYLAAASPTLKDIATLAVDTGLRPNSELFVLQWPNVHLQSTPAAPHGYLHVPAGKTGAARRTVPLTARGKAILERRRSAKVTSWYVFPGSGKSGHIVTIQHPHERTVKRAKIQPFEFYCWRHTCGTRWAEAGLDKFSIARLMGHSTPAIAEKHYIKVTESHVAAGFERFLGYLDRGLEAASTGPR